MSLQPAFLGIEQPGSKELVELCIGFSWGGDATKEIPREDEYAFKDAVLAAIKSSLETDHLLVSEMVTEAQPMSGHRRYRGGHTAEKVQEHLDAAVAAVMQKIRLPRSCAAILVER